MVEKSYFEKLNLKRKIYKAALSIRDAEKNCSKGIPDILSDCIIYYKYLSETMHRKAEKASIIISKALSTIESGNNPLKAAKALNFCFYELMDLINEQVNEQFFKHPMIKRFDRDAPSARFETAAILDNLRSPFNVGSIFRCADAFGTGELALCGITPHPPSPRVERTAMGTADIVSWKYYKETTEAIIFFREKGYKITGAETALESGNLFEKPPSGKTAFIFGNEEFGLSDEAVSLCDDFLEIPQVGFKNSMNVSCAFSIIMYETMRSLA